jgi:hypothetical protein
MIVSFNTYCHDAKITIECHDNGTGVKAYYKGKYHPKLSKWAAEYVQTTRGEMEVEDAARDERSGRYVDYLRSR